MQAHAAQRGVAVDGGDPVPAEDEREGYVPNVVYSCGSLAHGDVLVLPYGCSDAAVRVGVVDLPDLLDRIIATGPRRPRG